MERMAITGFQLLFVLVGKIFRPNKRYGSNGLLVCITALQLRQLLVVRKMKTQDFCEFQYRMLYSTCDTDIVPIKCLFFYQISVGCII